MENWHLFTAAFVLSVVDLSVLGAFLWYQLSTLYFAWHLCPMIVNRICELIAFMFTGGMLPSLFAFVQVLLSLFSTTIYANRQQHLQNKLLLAVYCTLLLYESLVALLLVKMGRYLKRPVSMGLQQSRASPGQQASQPYIAFHMFALFTQPLGSGCPYASNYERHQDSQENGFVTVQQPDGKKVMLGKVLQPKFELPMREESKDTKEESPIKDNDVTKEESPSKDNDVQVTMSSLSVLSEAEHVLIACGQASGLLTGVSPSALIPATQLKSDNANGNETSTSHSTCSVEATEHCCIEMPVLQGHEENQIETLGDSEFIRLSSQS